ncbi:hypothetical protein [Acidovorax sp. Leaf78]|nr:hypothetical protein [Acidovorax sp. Leaf78]
MRKVEAVTSGLPWKWVGALFFVVGCMPLLGYLIFVGYVPTNLLGLLGLAGISSVWLLLLWTLITVLMFGVVATAVVYEVKNLNWRTTLLGQLGPFFLLMGIFFRPLGLWFSVLCAVCGLCAIVWTLARLWREQPRRETEGFLLAIVALLLGGPLVSLGVLLIGAHSARLGLLGDPGVWTIALWCGATVVLICANAAVTYVRAAPVAVLALCFFSSGLIVMAVAGPRYVTAVVASQVGLRLPGTVEILVPTSTCATVIAAAKRLEKLTGADPQPICERAVNTLSVEVQLRWGDRWLIAAKSVNGTPLPKPGVRLTIPEKDTELILP